MRIGNGPSQWSWRSGKKSTLALSARQGKRNDRALLRSLLQRCVTDNRSAHRALRLSVTHGWIRLHGLWEYEPDQHREGPMFEMLCSAFAGAQPHEVTHLRRLQVRISER
jgi:hypothetical protein